VGFEPDEAFHRCLSEWRAAEGKLEPALDTDADVEATLRGGGGHRLTFVLNYRAEPAQIVLKKEYRELISERTVSGVFVLPGGQVAILDEPES
jgi:beta-galactosidase GanA